MSVLLKLTWPSINVTTVRPSSATARLNSVPRMAPEVSGVRNSCSGGFSRLGNSAEAELEIEHGLFARLLRRADLESREFVDAENGEIR